MLQRLRAAQFGGLCWRRIPFADVLVHRRRQGSGNFGVVYRNQTDGRATAAVSAQQMPRKGPRTRGWQTQACEHDERHHLTCSPLVRGACEQVQSRSLYDLWSSTITKLRGRNIEFLKSTALHITRTTKPAKPRGDCSRACPSWPGHALSQLQRLEKQRCIAYGAKTPLY